ncbi:MAG: 6-phospho-3-hexuloisomerase [Deinococcota bacterium]
MTTSDMSAKDMASKALSELGAVFDALSSSAVTTLISEIRQAKRLCLYGVGREGLMMRAFAMRLFHLGLDAHVVGDMTTPPVGSGDALIVSSGPGQFSTVLGLMGVAKDAGARTVAITAQPHGEAAKHADAVVHLPAQTMADDTTGNAGILPMGTVYEAAQLLFFELIIIQLREVLGQTADDMRHRHTNLE